MASLRKKPRSQFFFACFTLADGRRTQRSTKTADRKLAFKLATHWDDAARHRVTEAQARRVLSDIHEQIHGSRIDSPAVAEYAAQWLGRKQGETSPVTLAAYRHATTEFTAFLGEKSGQPIHYVTPAQIAAWRDAAAKKATPRTANNKLKVIRTFLQSAWRDGLLSENPGAKVAALKTGEGHRRAFTLAELRAVLREASPEWRGMIIAGLYTGQRLKDIASLTWANVDMERVEIRLSTSKTHRQQIIPIAKPLRDYLAELPAGDEPAAPLFPDAYRVATENRDVSPLSQQFYALLVTAGLARPRPKKHEQADKGRDGRRPQSQITFHSLRHTATSLLKRAGVSEAVVRDIIGHESAEVSRHYTHVDEETKRRAIAKLPNLLRAK